MKLLRIRQVIQITGLSRMTIYRLELAGKFPKRRQLSENSVAWLEADISQWNDSRPVAAVFICVPEWIFGRYRSSSKPS